MRVGLSMLIVLTICGLSSIAAGQARPLPGPDVPQIYQRLLPADRKDPHLRSSRASRVSPTILTSMPWLRLRAARHCANATPIPNWLPPPRRCFGYPYDDLSPEHAKWLVQKKSRAEEGAGQRLLLQYPRQAEHRAGRRQSRDDGGLSRSQALSLGLLRRFLHVAVRQSARARAQSPTRRSTSRCRRRCCIAGCNRKA